MLSVTRLLVGAPTPGDDLRYGTGAGHGAHPGRKIHRRPVVVWNITRRCNLHCAHCYSASLDREYPGELSTDEGRALIDDLAGFGVPVLLLSGGEPTMRADLADLIAHSVAAGVRPALSTNGTKLTREMVERLREAGLMRVGISLDGLEAANDKFRGQKGAFASALAGIRNSVSAGMRVSLRVTITNRNVADLPGLFDLAEAEGVPRVCVYHLAYAGRGKKLLSFDLEPAERRAAIDFVFRRTLESHASGAGLEVLTVDNHADAPYLLMWSRNHAPDRAAEIEKLLLRNGGNSAGRGIACVDNIGDVHPDQFWWNRSLGNVRERPFSEIWSDESIDLLARLRDRKQYLDRRCRDCQWLDMCNGNLRVRGETATGDLWGFDPACYLMPAERNGTHP